VPEVAGLIDRPPAIPQWFYCDRSKGYFPFVKNCPDNWRYTPAVPPPGGLSAAVKRPAVP
jgi:hypothetical protein